MVDHHHDIVSSYLSEDFDAQRCASKLLSDGTDVASILSQLSVNIAQVDKQLRRQIESHHEKLLEQATSVSSLETMQRCMQEHMVTLASTASRAQTRSTSLITRATALQTRLERARCLSHILANIVRALVLNRRLSAVSDVLKRSEMLQELNVLCSEIPIHSLPTLQARLVSLNRVESELRQSAVHSMEDALKTGNVSGVHLAVQALNNLGVLDVELDRLRNVAITELSHLATQMEKEERIVGQFVGRLEMWMRNFELLGVEQLRQFARRVADLMAKKIVKSLATAARLLQAIQPLLNTWPDTCVGIYLEALNPLRHSMHTQSMARLFERVNTLFDQVATPGSTDMEKLSAEFRAELAAVAWDTRLTQDMNTAIDKALEMFVVRVETALSLDLFELGTRQSEAERRNYQLLNAIILLHQHWPSVVSARNLLISVIDVLMERIMSTVDTVLFSMHNEPWEGKSKGEVSPYMGELLSILSRVRIGHLKMLESSRELAIAEEKLSRDIQLRFSLHVSLVRPLNADVAEQLAVDGERLAAELVHFRSKQDLLNITVSALRSCPNLASVTECPTWLSVNLLIASSPVTMPSPHDSAGWSLSEFISWFLKHSDMERLTFLRGLLKGYSSSVIANNEKEFVEFYPLMVQLLDETRAK